ncbi:class I SAM-dependent methyltransferase [Streptomyces griseorubiginosus]|uniref:class I SAM-dependent methyltransferase n=1 Tax=Streptomyces griseorubiginosus TaxID=67304 RepID=UPI001AD77F40|nr:methyltransferase domain-containing protein [Streptomyces griseorubiginosus]MBO4253176.1 methyltransferase domain-containing protein [Streptomyces griseorubiginosus]
MVQTAFDASERRAWAGQADAYAAGFAKLCAYPVPKLLEAAGVREGVRVLDVGTGTGTAAALACERAAKVTAVDAEPDMVSRAALAAPQADVRLAALPHLPFSDDAFDATVGNFVLNHVGQPRQALAELRRVTRTGGRVAVTIWAAPAAAGQTLLGRAVQAAGVTRPTHLPALAAEDDFPRTEQGLVTLLEAAGLTDVVCDTVTWDHQTTPEEWWSGPAAGVATIGQIVTSQHPEVIDEIKHHFEALRAEFTGPDGALSLPHAALIAHGQA